MPGTSLFLYFQLRSSMKAYGVPWSSSITIHPLHSILYNRGQKRGLVSQVYSLMPGCLDWEKIWSSIVFASKNPDHQQIHFNYIHRTYLTPRSNFLMKHLTSSICTLCSDGLTGSYMHTYWECKDVRLFWVRSVLLYGMYWKSLYLVLPLCYS